MGAKVLQFGDQEKKELYDLRLMLESFAFSKIKHIDRAPITKEMRKHLEMMKVAVKFEDVKHLHNMTFNFMKQ